MRYSLEVRVPYLSKLITDYLSDKRAQDFLKKPIKYELKELLASYSSKRFSSLNKKGYDQSKFTMIPLETTDQGWGKMDFYTTMGVRDGETDWKKKLNRFIKANQKEIDKILVIHNIQIFI